MTATQKVDETRTVISLTTFLVENLMQICQMRRGFLVICFATSMTACYTIDLCLVFFVCPSLAPSLPRTFAGFL